MSRFLSVSLITVLLWLAPSRVCAFALFGPFATWQSFELGYQFGGDQGGPMNINEGYRYTVPILTYGFDSTFLNFFGTNGVKAVEEAIAMFNALPPADAMTPDLSEFPLKAERINNTASALNLFDVKSITAGAIMEQLGLCSPERYVFTLRSRVLSPAPPLTSFAVIQRNWDPITWNQSKYVNGELFTYTILQTSFSPDAWEAVDIPVDPLASGLTTLAGYYNLGSGTIGRGAALAESFGGYFTSLTRDDAGGLRRLYASKNLAVDPLGPDVITGGGGGSVSVGGSTEAPWFPATAFTVVTNGATGGTSNNVPRMVTALRPGIGKVTFKRVDYDSLLTTTRVPYQITWTDRYMTNGVMRGQQVSRLVTAPDLLFSAADLGVNPTLPFLTARTAPFENNSALNSSGAGEHDGPGVMRPPLELTFSNAGRVYLNIAPLGAGVGESGALLIYSFGSFDGSTNAPILYPDGLSIQALEALVLNGQ